MTQITLTRNYSDEDLSKKVAGVFSGVRTIFNFEKPLEVDFPASKRKINFLELFCKPIFSFNPVWEIGFYDENNELLISREFNSLGKQLREADRESLINWSANASRIYNDFENIVSKNYLSREIVGEAIFDNLKY